MAITAETRQDIMELAVAANNAAPGTTLLSTLVAMSESGSSLLDIANELADSASFKATYPTFQTATEFATEFLSNLVPEAGADAVAEGVAIIEGLLNGGASRGEIILEAATYLAAADESNAGFGSSAALFNNRVEVAVAHTITNEEADSWSIPASVTSDDDSVATGTAEIPSVKAAADAAAAKAAEEKAAADAAAAAKAAEEKAAADAAAAEKALEDAATEAAADAATAIEAAEEADAALAAAQTASEEAAATAAETDAEALAAALETATTADTDAKAAVVTAQAAYDAALLAGVALDVSTANGELLIAQNNASLAAAALVEATAASEEATAADEAAAAAATALTEATEAAATAAAAADTAAAASVTAAAATADTADDEAAAAQVTAAAAAAPTSAAITEAAAEAAAAEEKAAADAAAAKAAEDKAAADKAAADAAAAEAEAARIASSQTITLTTGADTKTTAAGDDNFVGLNTTLTTGDNLNGGDGNDSLTLTTTLTNAGISVVGFTTTSIETAYIGIIDGSATDAEVLTVDMLNSSPASVVVTGSTATTAADGLTLSNVDSGTSVTMSATANLDLTVNYDATYLAGAGDTATLNLTGVTATAAADSDITFGTGIETLTVNSTSTASKIGDLVWGGAALTVTGDANLTIQDTLAVTANTIDASAFTGKLSVVLGNATDATDVAGVDVADLTVTGGAGNDTLNVAAADAGVELLVDGGAGNDTITIGADLDGATATRVADIIAGGDGEDTFAMTTALANGLASTETTGVSGFEVLKITDAHTSSVTLKNIQSGLSSVTLAAGANAGTLVYPAGDNTLVIGASNAGQLTVTDTGSATDDTLSISTTSLAAVDMGNNNAFVFTGLETVTINTTTKAATELDVSTITMTADTGGTTTLNVIGADTFHASGIITANVIDFSGMDAQATGTTTANMAVAAASVTSIKGSGGDDVLKGDAKSTIEGGAGNDNITGGSGNDTLHGDDGTDTITTGGGSDTVRGGDGNDTIVVAGNLSAADSLNGGEGTDTISVTTASLVTLQALSISDANTFNASFTSIETLLVSDALDTTGDDFDLGYLDGITTVKVTADVNGAQVIDGFDSGNTLAITAALTAGITAKVNSSTASASDVLNISLTEGADADYNALTIANVETINIDVTEDTAGGSATSQTATVGLSISQTAAAAGGSGAAQSVVITGSEDIVIDTTISVATIDASGMSLRLATTPGLVMTGAAYTKAQTITGSSGADTLIGSTKADTITGGAGNDTITGGTGGDTIDGGTGTDTYVGTTALTAATIEGAGTGTSTGVVVNLGATTLTSAAVLGTTAQNLSGGLSGVASGQVAYLFNGELSTNSAAVDTLTSIENVTLADGINYIVGSTGANVITGGSGVDTITAGNGADTITGGGAADVITLTETSANSAVDNVIWTSATAANIATETGSTAGTDNDFSAGTVGDKIVGFTSGKDTLTFATALTNNGTDTDTLKTIAAAGVVANNDVFVEVTTAAADGTMGSAITLINGLDTSAVAVNEDVVFFVHDGTNGYLYLLTQVSAADTVAAQDLTLIGQLTGVTNVADGDFVSG